MDRKPLFLTPDETAELTGYRKPSFQVRQLKTYGIRFFVAADGHPRVPRAEIEGGKDRTRHTAPNFDAIAARG